MGDERGFWSDVKAVTPVIGTLLILGISTLGITAIMVWGAPSIQRIQDSNAHVAMLGEFDNLQEVATVLQVPDASRDPRIVLPTGSFGFEEGTRILVTVAHDASNTPCDFQVTDWNSAPVTTVTVDNTDCRKMVNPGSGKCDDSDIAGDPEVPSKKACLEIHRVTGANTVRLTVDSVPGGGGSGAYSVSSADFSEGDWLFRLTDGATVTPTVYAEAWLLSSDRIAWELQSTFSDRGIYLDGGAVFSKNGGAIFLERDPPLYEGAFATDVYAFFLRTISADSYTSLSGSQSFRLFLGLTTQSARVVNDTVYKVAYAFDGDLEEAWCQSLLLRNSDIDGDDPYSLDNAASCDVATTPRILYEPTTTPFTYHFIHGDIRATLL